MLDNVEPAGVLRGVVGGGLVLAVVGLFAVGLVTSIRHTAGAITAYVGALLVVPIVIQALPSSSSQPIGKYLPFNISDTMTSVRHTIDRAPSFGPWVGFALLCGYASLRWLSEAGSWCDATPEGIGARCLWTVCPHGRRAPGAEAQTRASLGDDAPSPKS